MLSVMHAKRRRQAMDPSGIGGRPPRGCHRSVTALSTATIENPLELLGYYAVGTGSTRPMAFATAAARELSLSPVGRPSRTEGHRVTRSGLGHVPPIKRELRFLIHDWKT
jgi:hypothetical protein